MRRTKIANLIYPFAYFSGIIGVFYWLNRSRQRILVFHHIIPDEMKNESFEQQIVCSSASHFCRLLSIVNKRFEVTTEIGKPNSAVITFDDGYRAALIADGVLESFHNNAYFFVPLTIVDGGPLWVDQIMAWFAYVASGHYTICGNEYNLNSSAERLQAYDRVISGLYGNYDIKALMSALDDLHPFSELAIPPEYSALRFRGITSEEIGRLKQKGHKIGGHSVRHDILSQLDSETLEADFNTCTEQIGRLFNCDVYAYPFGHPRDVNSQCIAAASRSGFKVAVMNEYIPNQTAYKMSRINISHYTSRYEIEAELSGFKQWLRNLLKWKR